MEKRQASVSSLQPVLSSALHWELLSTILAFLVNDPLPDLPNFPGNGLLSLGTRYGDEIRITLKVRTCTFRCAT